MRVHSRGKREKFHDLLVQMHYLVRDIGTRLIDNVFWSFNINAHNN